MSNILTFIASKNSPNITSSHIKEVIKILAAYEVKLEEDQNWLSKNKALDIGVVPDLSSVAMMHIRDFASQDKMDVFVTHKDNRKKKILLADMDSTMVCEETLDELAQHAGLKDKIAEITTQAMEGKIDFKEALFQRVSLLEGLQEEALEETAQKTQLSEGARTLVQTMKEHSKTHTVLVSGGFTYFTSLIAQKIGFEHHHGNELEIIEGTLSGCVKEPILDKFAKVDFLNQYCEELSLGYGDVLAIGDGANDIPMLKKSGLGIGYHPKQAVIDEVKNLIIYGDLTAALYAQGYKDTDFVT